MQLEEFRASLRHLADAVFDPTQRLRYDPMAGAVVWNDEAPLEPPARWAAIIPLRLLAAHRTRMILGQPSDLAEHWRIALETIPQWPGFRPERLEATPEVIEILRRGEQCTEEALELLDYSLSRSPKVKFSLWRSFKSLLNRFKGTLSNRFGPSRWVLVGNIVDEYPVDDSGKTRRGTQHFRPGTKVYCWPPLWGDGYEKIVVTGINRHGRWITVIIPSNRITNWRANVAYSPVVIRRLEAGYRGKTGFWDSKKDVQTTLDSLHRHRTESSNNAADASS